MEVCPPPNCRPWRGRPRSSRLSLSDPSRVGFRLVFYPLVTPLRRDDQGLSSDEASGFTPCTAYGRHFLIINGSWGHVHGVFFISNWFVERWLWCAGRLPRHIMTTPNNSFGVNGNSFTSTFLAFYLSKRLFHPFPFLPFYLSKRPFTLLPFYFFTFFPFLLWFWKLTGPLSHD